MSSKSAQSLPPFQADMQYGDFHKWGIPQNGWFVMENSSNYDDLTVFRPWNDGPWLVGVTIPI